MLNSSLLQHKIMIWSYDFILLNYKHIQNIKWANAPRHRRMGARNNVCMYVMIKKYVCAFHIAHVHAFSLYRDRYFFFWHNKKMQYVFILSFLFLLLLFFQCQQVYHNHITITRIKMARRSIHGRLLVASRSLRLRKLSNKQNI